MGSILTSLAAINPFATAAIEPHSTSKHFTKPQTKTKFKQNQRKERKASARRKAK